MYYIYSTRVHSSICYIKASTWYNVPRAKQGSISSSPSFSVRPHTEAVGCGWCNTEDASTRKRWREGGVGGRKLCVLLCRCRRHSVWQRGRKYAGQGEGKWEWEWEWVIIGEEMGASVSVSHCDSDECEVRWWGMSLNEWEAAKRSSKNAVNHVLICREIHRCCPMDACRCCDASEPSMSSCMDRFDFFMYIMIS